MEFLEKDLETIIWEASDEQLEKTGLYFSGRRFRQLKIGNYGIADLITAEKTPIVDYDRKTKKETFMGSYLNITIYELKKDKIGVSAFLQAISYAKGIKDYLEKREFNNFIFNIVLVGKSVDLSGSVCFLEDLIGFTIFDDSISDNFGKIESLSFYTYSVNIDGLRFENKSGYGLINKGF